MSTTKASHPSRARLLQTAILALACAAVASPAFARSAARNAFDGDWSVVISTQSGACDPSFRYGVQIADGQVLNGGNSSADVRGQVAPSGLIRVNVQAGGQWANGSGRLERTRGSGVWQGQGSAGACSGTWVAQRQGYGPVAGAEEPGAPMAQAPGAAYGPPPGAAYGPVPGTVYGPPPATPYAPPPGTAYGPPPGAPIYGFAPQPTVQAPAAQAASAADYCTARFRTYDPASGTYRGSDGMRHPCP
jgi:hypothetical protein